MAAQELVATRDLPEDKVAEVAPLLQEIWAAVLNYGRLSPASASNAIFRLVERGVDPLIDRLPPPITEGNTLLELMLRTNLHEAIVLLGQKYDFSRYCLAAPDAERLLELAMSRGAKPGVEALIDLGIGGLPLDCLTRVVRPAGGGGVAAHALAPLFDKALNVYRAAGRLGDPLGLFRRVVFATDKVHQECVLVATRQLGVVAADLSLEERTRFLLRVVAGPTLPMSMVAEVIEGLRYHEAPLDPSLPLSSAVLCQRLAAVKTSGLPHVRMLLDLLGDAGFPIWRGQDPETGMSLMHALLSSPSAEFEGAPLVPYLLAKGVPVNAVDAKGNSVLHAAVARGHLPTVDLLVQSGADLWARNLNRQLPIGVTGRDAVVDRDIVGWLSHCMGRDIPNGQTPLIIAVRADWVAKADALLAAGADLTAIDDYGNGLAHYIVRSPVSPPLVAALVRHGFDFGQEVLGKESPTLHKGASEAWVKMGLISALMHRAVETHGEKYVAMVDAVICHGGCDLNATDRGGRTLLHMAIKGELLSTVRELLAAGADPSIKLGNVSALAMTQNAEIKRLIRAARAGEEIRSALADLAEPVPSTAPRQLRHGPL